MPTQPHPSDDAHGSANSVRKPAIKEFIQSPNRSSRNGAAIAAVVLHCTEGSWASTRNTFLDGSPSGRQVSAHYVIDRNGDIYQMVADNERANHCRGANKSTIGIEHVGSETDSLAPAQEGASAALIRWLLEQYDIPKSAVYGHDFAPGYTGSTSCPDKLFGKAHSQATITAWVSNHI